MLSFRSLAVTFVALSVGLAGLMVPTTVSAAATPYETRRDAVILSHYQSPSPPMTGCTDHRGYLNYATAALWLQQSVADANNRLAAVQISHITGQNCNPGIDVSRAN